MLKSSYRYVFLVHWGKLSVILHLTVFSIQNLTSATDDTNVLTTDIHLKNNVSVEEIEIHWCTVSSSRNGIVSLNPMGLKGTYFIRSGTVIF